MSLSNRILSKILLLSTIFLMPISSSATQQQVEMANELRSSGKIYVVVTVLVILLLGFIFYLFSLDRRIKKIEKK